MIADTVLAEARETIRGVAAVHVGTSRSDFVADDIIAALAERGIRLVSEDSLDAAWAEAEAALPEGWAVDMLKLLSNRTWVAWASHHVLTRPWEQRNREGVGPTPAAALRALAARLSEGSGSDV